MKNEREQELISRLSIVQKLSLAEAMELLGISESTARRMFSKLEADGIAIRTHGGIQTANKAMTLYSFEYGARTNIEKKRAIGREACKYLEDGDVVFCDSGTTIQCMCAELIYRIRRDKLNIRVYTNSLANLELLSPYLQVNLVGGEYRDNRKDFCGFLSEQALAGVYFTKCFVGADGCSEDFVFTTTDFETARMNQIAMKNSGQIFMLADSSKFRNSSHVAYVPAERIHTIVTDSELPAEIRETIKTNRLICVTI